MPDDSFRSESAEIVWQEDGLPFSARFQDVYYGKQDAVGESQHVFLAASNLSERWIDLAAKQSSFVIAELGFGAGLNFMLSWQLWEQSADQRKGQQTLHYIAFERFPVNATDLARVHQQWPDLANLSQRLLANYRSDCNGWHRLMPGANIILDLFIGDAVTALARRHAVDAKIDAWYLDGFAPQRNPELWSAELCNLIAAHSHANSTVTTYSSAGKLRRNLQQAGFNVQKAQGFSGKRHMLIASGLEHSDASATPSRFQDDKPWFRFPLRQTNNRNVIVIGAGLAGCHTAHALARRNWQVCVLERESQLASGVTRIPQLALRCRLFSRTSIESRFYLQSYLFALAVYHCLQNDNDCGWHPSGLWQSVDALNRRRPVKQKIISQLYPESIVRIESGHKLFKQLPDLPGFSFEGAGWLDPHMLCNQLLKGNNISLQLGCQVSKLEREGDRWLVFDGNNICATAEHVILTNGAGLSRLEPTRSLPLDVTSGQCTLIAAQAPLDQLDRVISSNRTLFPASDAGQTIAATYISTGEGQAANNETTSSEEQDAENLAALTNMFPGYELSTTVLAQRSALRVNTRDRLPLVGPLANFPVMEKQYAGLSRNARQEFREAGAYHPGLYISAGHGSNGLATCPISGEYLASLLNGDPLPLDRDAIEALNPSRFLIQDLKKQRVV